MRTHVRALVKVTSETLDLQGPVYDLGSFQVGGQEAISNLRPFFAGKRYVGCDIREGPGVDKIEDIHNLSLSDGVVGTILVMETLEHVKDPFTALKEVKRVLSRDGVVIMSSAMDFPIHEIPYDYWRFTPAGFDLLLQGFPARIIGTLGHPSNPHTVFGIGFKQCPTELPDLLQTMKANLSEELKTIMREERVAAKAVRRLGQLLGLIPCVARALRFALARSTHFHLEMQAVTE